MPTFSKSLSPHNIYTVMVVRLIILNHCINHNSELPNLCVTMYTNQFAILCAKLDSLIQCLHCKVAWIQGWSSNYTLITHSECGQRNWIHWIIKPVPSLHGGPETWLLTHHLQWYCERSTCMHHIWMWHTKLDSLIQCPNMLPCLAHPL